MINYYYSLLILIDSELPRHRPAASHYLEQKLAQIQSFQTCRYYDGKTSEHVRNVNINIVILTDKTRESDETSSDVWKLAKLDETFNEICKPLQTRQINTIKLDETFSEF